MKQEKEAVQSPFAALTYQEQQDRWLEWRSRQLDYQTAEREWEAQEKPTQKAAAPSAYPQMKEPPPIQLPYIQHPAPTRHGELDKLRAKHAQAAKRAGQFQAAPINSGSLG